MESGVRDQIALSPLVQDSTLFCPSPSLPFPPVHLFVDAATLGLSGTITPLTQAETHPFCKSAPKFSSFSVPLFTFFSLRLFTLQQLDTDLLGSVLSAIKQRHFQKHLNFFFGANPWDCACEGLQQMQVACADTCGHKLNEVLIKQLLAFFFYSSNSYTSTKGF